MRIVSSFRDYYDSVSGQGVDMTRLYKRATSEVLGNFPLPGWNERKGWRQQKDNEYPQLSDRIWTGGGVKNRTVGYLYILLAGKLYGGLKLRLETFPVREFFIWDQETLDQLRYSYDLLEDNKYRWPKNTVSEYDRAKKVLSIRGDEILRDWSIENNISIAMACDFFVKDKRIQYYTIDPVLRECNFQKVLDPFTAYQELDMWIGGVIGQNPQPSEVSDAVKIQQHGFDKWSFRKHKLDNKN